jgi:hypothetical protein
MFANEQGPTDHENFHRFARTPPVDLLAGADLPRPLNFTRSG